jgi:hypothetical protein
MKRFLLFLFAFGAMAQSGFAQSDSVRFEIMIGDPSAISHYMPSGIPVFNSSAINTILAGYYISEFAQAYPDSRELYLQKIYQVRCNNINLATALKAADPKLFPQWKRSAENKLCFTPNDWGTLPGSNPGYLDYIKARQAWDITKGDPSVVVGVLDIFFNTSHPDFYNSLGDSKIERVGLNTHYPHHHGTAVASLVAAATHNSRGLPAIGFNCRLDLSTDWSGNNMLNMSKRTRIINCSWFNDYEAALNLRNHFAEQGLYNEVYENGTLVCAGAVNGSISGVDPNDYCYPASYDHVISSTNVCWKNDGLPATTNIKGNHAFNTSDPLNTFNHNSRVDICAPGYEIDAFRYDASDPSVLYYNGALGTSVTSPIVAGAAGLIQSALKNKAGGSHDANFSPYQLEWILKKTANPDMLSKPENAPFTGKLGAGRLSTDSAAKLGSTLDPNDAPTQTMYIQGIEFNSLCAPGHASNGVLPRLKAVIVNGLPPYTYVWEEVPDGTNTAILDNENIAEPTITGIKPGATKPFLNYRLTVYDNSPVAQKVAMKTFRINLKTAGHDLAMRDSYMDMCDEPNSQRITDPRDWNTWTSPDVWNRQLADGGLSHQNPEYFVSAPNHIYTRIRNVGCAPSHPASKLRLYWTKSSTGEGWDEDWTITQVCGEGFTLQPGGKEITTGTGIAVPVLQPGEEIIIHEDWFPVEPQLYCGRPNTFDVCFLARLEGTTGSGIGMTIPEKFTYSPGYDGIGPNIRNNNNIVTRNFILTNLKPGNFRTAKHVLTFGNANGTAGVFNLEFASERSIFRHFAGDFSGLGSVTLHLGDLYNVWVSSGGLGTVAGQNAQLRTVTFDGANTLRLENIPLPAGQKYVIGVEFSLDSPLVVNETSRHIFHARQFNTANPDEIYGAVNYEVTVSPAVASNLIKDRLDSSPAGTEGSFHLSPNPTSGILQIRYSGLKANTADIVVRDMTGKDIMTSKAIFTPGATQEIDLSELASGVYMVSMTDASGKTEAYKVVKK